MKKKKWHVFCLGALMIGNLICSNSVLAAESSTPSNHGYMEKEQQLAAAGTETIDVTDYGADGSDKQLDTDALQKALDAVKEIGGTVRVQVPNGIYYINKSLTVHSNTVLSLDSKAEIVRTDITEPMLRNYKGDPYQVLAGKSYDHTSNITVEGGKWNGNVSGKSSDKAEDLIRMYCGSNITFRNTTLTGVCGFHHLDFGAINGLTVTNVTFTGFVYYTGTNYSSLEDASTNTNASNASASVTSEALQLDYFENKKNICKNVTVTGCNFDGVLSGIGTHHTEGSGSNVKIKDNNFLNIANTCVNLYSFSGVEVSGNKAENVRSFARVYGGKDCTISNNVISNYTGKNKFNMFRISDKAKLTISGNTINGSGNTGIKLDSGSNGEIIGNKITNTPAYAISIDKSTANISNNIIKNAKNIGICLRDGKADNISKNTVTNPKGDGIYVRNTTVGNISANVVTSAKGRGITCNKSEITTVTGNTIKTADGDGIGVIEGSKITKIGGSGTEQNFISGVATNGIAVKKSAVTMISFNEIKSSKSANIRVEDATSAMTISNNNLTSAAKQGISVKDTKVKIQKNCINKSTTYGIYLDGKKNNATVKNNEIATIKKGNGIRIYNGKVSASSNTIKKSKNQGIYILKGTVTLSDNKVSGSGKEGLKAAGGTVYLISGNAKMKLSGKHLTVVGTSNKTASEIRIPSNISVDKSSFPVKEIKESAFKNNKKITNVTIGDKVIQIGNSAFKGCSKLNTVTMGASLKTIGKEAFRDCKSLSKVTVKTKKLTDSSIGANAFKSIKSKCTFKVPKSKVSAYKKLFKNKGAGSKTKNTVM